MNGHGPGLFSIWEGQQGARDGTPPSGGRLSEAEVPSERHPTAGSDWATSIGDKMTDLNASMGFSFLPTRPEEAPHINPNSNTEAVESAGSFVDDFLGLTQNWCCATKSQANWLYTTDPHPPEKLPMETVPENGHEEMLDQSPRLRPSPFPASFKQARNHAAIIEGIDRTSASPEREHEIEPERDEQEAEPANMVGIFTSDWPLNGLGISLPPDERDELEEGDDQAGPAVRDALVPVDAPVGSFRVIPPGERRGLASPGSAFQSVAPRGHSEIRAGTSQSFNEWMMHGRASSPGIDTNYRPEALASMAVGAAGRTDNTRAEGAAKPKQDDAEAERLRQMKVNSNKDLLPIGSDLLSPDKKLSQLPFSKSRRRNTIAASNTYTEVHTDEPEEHQHQTMQQHGKTGSRAPDHDVPTPKFIRHRIRLTLLEEGPSGAGRAPTPVKAPAGTPSHKGKGRTGSLKGSLKGSQGSVGKDSAPKKKRASYEWAMAFVSHRRVSDDNYRIGDDLVQGQGSEMRSAVLRALGNTRVLPRMDQVHVDTQTAGQVTVYISESQDIGTLIPRPDDLADDLMRQATQPGSRLAANLDGYLITSANRLEDPAKQKKPQNGAHAHGLSRPVSLDGASGGVPGLDSLTRKSPGRLSRMYSVVTGKSPVTSWRPPSGTLTDATSSGPGPEDSEG